MTEQIDIEHDEVHSNDKENNNMQPNVKPCRTGWFTKPSIQSTPPVLKPITRTKHSTINTIQLPLNITKENGDMPKANNIEDKAEVVAISGGTGSSTPTNLSDSNDDIIMIQPATDTQLQHTALSTIADHNTAHTDQFMSMSPSLSPQLSPSTVTDQLNTIQSMNTKIQQLPIVQCGADELDQYMSAYIIKSMLSDLPPAEYKKYFQRHIDTILQHIPHPLIDGLHSKTLNTIHKLTINSDVYDVQATSQPDVTKSFTTPAPQTKHRSATANVKSSPVVPLAQNNRLNDTVNNIIHGYSIDCTLQQTIALINQYFHTISHSIATIDASPQLSAAGKQRIRDGLAVKKQQERDEKHKQKLAKQHELDEQKRLKQLDLDEQKKIRQLEIDNRKQADRLAKQHIIDIKNKQQPKLFGFLHTTPASTDGTTSVVTSSTDKPTIDVSSTHLIDMDMAVNNDTTIDNNNTTISKSIKRKHDDVLFYPYEAPKYSTVAPIHRVKRVAVDILDNKLFDHNNSSNRLIRHQRYHNRNSIRLSRHNKFLQYHDNYRPAFYGRINQSTGLFSGRHPFSKDSIQLNYDDDSGDDWNSEPDDGEDLLSGCDDEDSDEDSDGSRADGLEHDDFVADIDENEQMLNIQSNNKRELIPRICGPVLQLHNIIQYCKTNKHQTEYTDQQIYDYSFMNQFKLIKLVSAPINRIYTQKPIIQQPNRNNNKPSKPVKKKHKLTGMFSVFKQRDFTLPNELKLCCDQLMNHPELTIDSLDIHDNTSTSYDNNKSADIKLLFQQQKCESEFPYLNQWLLPLIPDAIMTGTELATIRVPKPMVPPSSTPIVIDGTHSNNTTLPTTSVPADTGVSNNTTSFIQPAATSAINSMNSQSNNVTMASIMPTASHITPSVATATASTLPTPQSGATNILQAKRKAMPPLSQSIVTGTTLPPSQAAMSTTQLSSPVIEIE